MDSKNFTYINLNNNIDEIFFDEHSSVFICIYNISFVKEDLPFLQYLLYRQKVNLKKKKHNLASFPYIHYEKDKETTINNVNHLVNQLTEHKVIFNGFIKDNMNFYLFYNQLEPIGNTTYNAESEIIWGTIDEIVNKQKLLDCYVHYNTFELFYKHTKLLHIKNSNDEGIIIPYAIISKIPKNKCILDEIEKYDEEREMFYIDDHSFSFDNDTLRHVMFLYFNSDLDEDNYMYDGKKYFLKDKSDAAILSINHKN